jgi:DNA-binding NtrC family response regulator
MSHARVLILDDDEIVLHSLVEFLKAEGHEVHGAGTLAEATERIGRTPLDLVIADVCLPDGSAFKLLERTRETHPGLDIVLVTGYGTIEDAVQAIKCGASDYITKPLVDSEVRLVIEQTLRRNQLKAETEKLRETAREEFDLGNLVCRDAEMEKVVEMAGTVANTTATVLLTGESGTGKTVLARAMHFNSGRAAGPFVEVACGALTDSLLESELFGHEAGAFTGATHQRKGKFEAADGGTIFLDEIATASPQLQVKLLRVIQDGCFERVGGSETLRVNVRIILATNVDLAKEVAEGRFREDLYYRIHVMPIGIPPLRERPDDIPALVDHFIRKHTEETGKTVHGAEPSVLEALSAYSWPGNVRELENVIERGLVLAQGDRIQFGDLPVEVVRESAAIAPAAPDDQPILPLKKALEGPEREIILRALRYADGNRNEAAKLLGINRSTLFNKMRRLDLTGVLTGN